MKGLILKQNDTNKFEANSLNLLASHRDLQVLYLNIPSKKGIILSPITKKDGFEFIYIINGEMEYQDGDDTVKLVSGDFLHHSKLEKSFTVYAITDCNLITFSNTGDFEDIDTKYKRIISVIDEITEKDRYTRNHCLRVGIYAQKLASHCNKEISSIQDLMLAANSHDIGKCMIPDDVLLKPGRFTFEERQIMNKHSEYSYNILKNDFDISENVCKIAACHHERYDGTGYPYGLSGIDIPIESRIIAIVDTFDAMTTSRPYQDARTPEEAVAEMHRFSHEYDPELFKIFTELVKNKVIHPSSLPTELVP